MFRQMNRLWIREDDRVWTTAMRCERVKSWARKVLHEKLWTMTAQFRSKVESEKLITQSGET